MKAATSKAVPPLVLHNNLPDLQKCLYLPYFWGHPIEPLLLVRERPVAFIPLVLYSFGLFFTKIQLARHQILERT